MWLDEERVTRTGLVIGYGAALRVLAALFDGRWEALKPKPKLRKWMESRELRAEFWIQVPDFDRAIGRGRR
jgi:hypothetical protein